MRTYVNVLAALRTEGVFSQATAGCIGHLSVMHAPGSMEIDIQTPDTSGLNYDIEYLVYKGNIKSLAP